MVRSFKYLLVGVVACAMTLSAQLQCCVAQSDGTADLDEATRIKVIAQPTVTVEGMRDLNRVIELLQSALDKGLEKEDAEFAEGMLADALMERSGNLVRVVNSRSIFDTRVQKVRALIVSDLRRVLSLDTPPAEAHYLLGRMMAYPGGDPHEARREITEFLNSPDIPDEQRAEALLVRARVQSEEELAMADFAAALELEPDNSVYRLARAAYFRGKEKFDEALADIAVVLESDPDDANALIQQGQILQQTGKIEQALESFDRATEIVPQVALPYQNRGQIYREQEEYEKAIAEFTKVIELMPGDLTPLIHRADAYLAAEKFEQALADIEIVLEENDEVAAAHHVRAQALANLNRLDEAIAEMEQLAAAMPDQLELRMQLALYYLVGKRPRMAIEAYDAVLEADADNFLALRSRGDAYLNIGDHARAISDFQQGLNAEPDDTTVLNNLAWVLATSPEDHLRNGEQALELAKRACELTEYNKPHILSTLAAAHAEVGNFEEAIKWSETAVDIGDPMHQEQLVKELANYREGKPWRELQSVEEAEPQPVESPNANDLILPPSNDNL